MLLRPLHFLTWSTWSPQEWVKSLDVLQLRTDDVPIDKLFGTVVLERVVDTLMFGVMLLITVITQAQQLSIFLTQSGASLPTLSPTLIIGLIVGGLLVLIGLWTTRKTWSQWSFAQRVIGFIQGPVEGLRSIQKVDNKFLFWAYSVGIWTCYTATIVVGFKVVPGLEALGLSEAILRKCGCRPRVRYPCTWRNWRLPLPRI